jgi:hypothetical protein
MMNYLYWYWFAAIPVALYIGYKNGWAAGRDAERDRVNYGMNLVFDYLLSKTLYLLDGWVNEKLTEDRLLAGIKEYAEEKKAKRTEQDQAFMERLSRHREGGDGS